MIFIWISITVFERILIAIFLIFVLFSFFFAAQQNKRMLAVFREWSSLSSNENSKVGVDRGSRDKIKKMKNLLTDNLPADNVVALA